MTTYRVSANVTVSVTTEVEAETAFDAIEIASGRLICDVRHTEEIDAAWHIDTDGEPRDICCTADS